MPANVKKAIEVVAGLIRETPDHQLLILAVLLLWARKYGGTAWQEYCEALLPPGRELSCLLTYVPSEMPMLQLQHLTDEASRQHDWARWTHTQWTSSISGALRRLGLADDPAETAWALAVVRSRAVEFPVGAAVGRPAPGPGSGAQNPPGTSAQGSRGGRGGPIVAVLAPVIDLANHSPDPNCVIQLTTDRSRVVLLPRRPIAAGEPLTVDYGFDRSSVDLMVDYGFVTPGNPHDGELPLAGAEKLPPLELARLQAAARALRRKRQVQRLQIRRRAERPGAGRPRPGSVTAAERGGEGAEEEVEGEEDGDEGGSVALALADDADVDAEEDASFSGRIEAAVRLLAPRATPFAPDRGFSSPATQRIIAGLWHKLVRHTADGLPTTLEQDLKQLYDIQAGHVSGFGGGVRLTLDPAPLPQALPAGRRQAATADAAGFPGGRPLRDVVGASPAAPGPPGATSGSDGTVRGPQQSGQGKPSPGVETAPSGGGDTEAWAGRLGSNDSWTGPASGDKQDVDDGSGLGPVVGGAADQGKPTEAPGAAGRERPEPGAAAAAAGEAGGRTPLPTKGVCRSGRRAGRLYAAVRARIEYKELLRVAEDLLMQYGMN